MQEPGTLGYMLRMTGELRDAATLGLRSVPRPPMGRTGGGSPVIERKGGSGR